MATIREIFQRYLAEYLKASKPRKREILDTVCELTHFHRKAAVRKFKVLQMRISQSAERRGRPVVYTPDVTAALKDVWIAGSEVCGELLCGVTPEYVRILERDRLWPHRRETTEKLLRMSEGTMKARVGAFLKARRPRHGLSATSPSALKEIIPVFIGPWKDKPPGFGQVDTVVHCGNTLAGDMIFSVNYTDIALRWVVLRAQWNKGQRATKDSLEYIRTTLPFPLKGLHPDTGSEFINWFVKDWADERRIELTRSRPYHKNDNAYVEQKNGHVIRRFLGYSRLDVFELVPMVNEYYELLGIYLNHFVATKKCLEKMRIGSKYQRKYDAAQTPYMRALAHPLINETVKAGLRIEHVKLNPLRLKQQLDRLKTKIFTLQRQSGVQILSETE